MRKQLMLLFMVIIFTSCSTTPPPAPTPLTITVPANFATESTMLVQARTPARVSEMAPDFSYTLIDGSVKKLSELRGQRVVLNFWASWCIPCREEMPALVRTQQAYAGQGVTILAVNRNEMPEAVARYITEEQIDLPAIVNTSGDIGDAYGITGLPISIFINRDGTIGFKQVGAMDEALIKERIEALQ